MLTLYSDQVKMPDEKIIPSYHKIHCPQEDLTYLCCYNPSNGMSDLKVHLFAAKVDTEITDIDKNEVHAKQWVPKENIFEILKENRTQCGVSILGLLYAIQFYL